MTPEGKIKDHVKRELSRFSLMYRFMPVQRGMGAPALDFYYCINGLFVAVETKVPGADLTGRQKHTALQIAAAGGIVFAIRCRDDIENMIARIMWRIDRPAGTFEGDIVDNRWTDWRTQVYECLSAQDASVENPDK